MFEELGAAVVDTDEISRELTAPGGAAIAAIRDAVRRRSTIAADGGLDRDADARAWYSGMPAREARLEAILHPLIRAAARDAHRRGARPVRHRGGAAAARDRRLIAISSQRVLVVDCERRGAGRARHARAAGSPPAKCARSWRRSCRAPSACGAPTTCSHNDGGIEALRRQVAAAPRPLPRAGAQGVTGSALRPCEIRNKPFIFFGFW